MQARYLGDNKDFVKYALLWHLHKSLGLQLGVNWYYTDPAHIVGEKKGDGKGRSYLAWRELDSCLYDKMDSLNRNVDAARKEKDDKRIEEMFQEFLQSEILPKGTKCFPNCLSEYEKLDPSKKKEKAAFRSNWHRQAYEALKGANLIFLDPDTGLEGKTSGKTLRGFQHGSSKYVSYSEACDYLQKDRVVVIIFFPPYNKSEQARFLQGHYESLERMLGRNLTRLPLLTFHMSPDTSFLSLTHPDTSPEIIQRTEEALISFAKRVPEKMRGEFRLSRPRR